MKKNWLRNFGKAIIIVLIAIVIIDTALVLGFAWTKPAISKADAAIVLGAAINTPALYNRTLEGLKLFEQGKVSVLALSGGRVSEKDISEAQYMERVIKRNAKIMPTLILDQESRNTYENIKNVKNKLPEAKSVVVVSDEFHLARAVILAKRAGYTNVYWSSPQPTYYTNSELAYYYFREIVAMITYIPKFVSG